MAISRFLRPVVPATVVAAVLLLSVAGCSSLTGTSTPASTVATAPTPAASSSAAKTAACTLLGSSLQDLGKNAQTAYGEFAKDPQPAVAALTKAASQFQASAAKLVDPGAQALAAKAQTDLAALVKEAQNAVQHPVTGAAAVASGVQTLQSDVTKIGSYCS